MYIRSVFILWAGFNPVWNETITFTAQFPDLCLLRFVVYDSDTLSDDFIGQYTLPLDSVEKGKHVTSVLTVIDYEMYLVKSEVIQILICK